MKFFDYLEIVPINELKKASEHEYYSALNNLYQNAEMIQMIMTSDLMAKQFGEHHLEKTDNGNLFLNYVENESSIFILGITTIAGKMNREDVSELLPLITMLENKLISGKTLYTSPMEETYKILMKLKKSIESKGYSFVERERMHPIEFNGKTFKNLEIRVI